MKQEKKNAARKAEEQKQLQKYAVQFRRLRLQLMKIKLP